MPVEENNVWIIKTTNESTFECWEFSSIELILTCIITYACTSVHMHIQTHILWQEIGMLVEVNLEGKSAESNRNRKEFILISVYIK